MKRITYLTGAVTLGVLLTVSGCKSSDPQGAGGAGAPASASSSPSDPPASGAAGSPGHPKPCSLVTASEAGTALGGSATTEVTNADDTIDTVCKYAVAATESTLQVAVRDYSVTAAQLAVSQSRSSPVSGLGDAAYWDSGAGTLTVVKGGVMVALDLLNGDNSISDSQLKAAAISLMKTALTRS
jgi:hypothetical protein